MKPCFEKILFFDIGGVLLSNGWGHASRQEAARRFNFDYEEMNRLHEFIFNVYEVGSISLDEYLDTVLFYSERDFTREEFKEFMFSQSKELPHMLEWLIQWRRKNTDRFRFISINNEGRELNDYRIKKFRLHDFFDAFVSSCEVGMIKPDPGIFRLAMGIAQAEPRQCLYFDDRPFLVQAAAKTGMRAYQHKDFESTRSILERLV
ncbi:MAG TPA: HAD-IA family hydrolase [Flavisolibacter sp.]|nr:HAD-IA family hydrolase [Flavisolibacter sp.]